jgi:NTE family protein
LKGFVLPFLGQQDAVLAIRPPDLVTRDQVAGYPTNFARMKPVDLERLTKRGEQLTRLMIEQHCPEIG